MDIYWLTLFFAVGTILGSFFNVVGIRVPRKIPFKNDRSYCPTCYKTLRWFELIPILSFILQRGACRNCKGPILPIYPITEFMTGILFTYSYYYIGFNVELIVALLLISMLMIISVSDIMYMLIPNRILLFFLPLFILVRIINPLRPWFDSVIGAFIGIAILIIIILLSKGGMGGGDMKLFGLLGIILGWKLTLLTLFIASSIGAIYGMTLILINRNNRKQPIPFGPFISVAALISYFKGEQLISIYLALL